MWRACISRHTGATLFRPGGIRPWPEVLVGNGSGVTVSASGKKWRVRWREVDANGKTSQPTRVVSTHAAAVELAAKVLRAIETVGYFEDGRKPVEPPLPPVCTLDEIATGWCTARAGEGLAFSTSNGSIANADRALKAVRAVLGLPEGSAVPVALLTRDVVIKVRAWLRESVGEPPKQRFATGTAGHSVTALLTMWTWASDDPATYPGVPNPPRELKSLRVKRAVSVAPPPPTMAECDAVVRRVAALGGKARNVALPVAVVGRYTGLRVRQILGIQTADVNLAGATMVIRIGKSNAEKKERRTVPIALELRDWLAPYVARAQAEGREGLFARRSDAGVRRKGTGKVDATKVSPPDRTLHRAWEAATAAGETRREVWDPDDAEQARPDHAFRSALQGVLVEAGIRDEVIDLLVGHVPKTTRGRHYVDAAARMEAMRSAINLVPAIDWVGAEQSSVEPSNVFEFGSRR